MSEYKRLTKQVFNKVQGCEDKMTMHGQSLYDLYNRLAELEDKIENGTLIELPCKVGDTIYEVFKNHKPPFIQQTKVEKIIVTEIGNIYITNIRKIKSLLTDYGYTVKFITCKDDDSYELVTELVITWYNK